MGSVLSKSLGLAVLLARTLGALLGVPGSTGLDGDF
jgi:hypothetical protein